MLPDSCSLGADELRAQLERYRLAGEGGRLIEHGRRSLVVEIGPVSTEDQIELLIATERRCCPFFEVDWDPEPRRLSLTVTQREHEGALAAIAAALTSGRGRARG